jgi:hypothetical protein
VAAVEPMPPASTTVRTPAVATELATAEAVIARTRRRALSRCSTEARPPRHWGAWGFVEFVMTVTLARAPEDPLIAT